MEQNIFESIKKINEFGNEYWSAREFYKILEYSEYAKFLPAINRAKESCKSSKESVENHFANVSEMIKIATGTVRETERKIENIKLSRFACYLIIQNADPKKEAVALGQKYFTIQTRKQEINEQLLEDTRRKQLRDEMKTHNIKLADAAKKAGVVEPKEYAIFTNYGYMGLYNGMKNKDIHAKKGLKKSQKILDHMGSEELAANLFRATQAEAKLRRENIIGKSNANNAHMQVGKEVRKTIETLGNTMPEELPVSDGIGKVERRLKKEEKELFNG